MPVLKEKDGQDILEFNKSETRKLLEAVAIVARAARWLRQDGKPTSLDAFCEYGRVIAKTHGGRYLDANGNLIESPQRQASDAGVTEK